MFCEAFLCCESHLGLWCKLFCIKLQTSVDETCECGGAAVSKVADSKYLPREFVETNKNWQEEWVYIPDVGLENPPRAGIVTPFTPTPLTRRHSWSPKNNAADSWSTAKLAEKVAELSDRGLTLVDVMHVALSPGILLLQA